MGWFIDLVRRESDQWADDPQFCHAARTIGPSWSGSPAAAPVRGVERAILACLSGEPQAQIATRLSTHPNTVSKWRIRFAQQGIAGLADAPRSGKPKTYGPDLRTKLLAVIETPPPKGQARWDGQALAKAVGAKKSTVYALLQKEGIHLQRSRSWCVSTDPQFAAKAADIVGLYLAPPQRALVLSVDEKPSIQALSRATGYVRTSSGKIARGLKSTYRRNGTLNLFAALDVATGKVRNKTTATKTRADFQAFMDEVVADVPADREIHAIVDNYCTHKKNDAWLKAHPNVTFHFTPTSASWLNQVEVWHPHPQGAQGGELRLQRGSRKSHSRLLRSLARERPPLHLAQARGQRRTTAKYYPELTGIDTSIRTSF